MSPKLLLPYFFLPFPFTLFLVDLYNFFFFKLSYICLCFFLRLMPFSKLFDAWQRFFSKHFRVLSFVFRGFYFWQGWCFLRGHRLFIMLLHINFVNVIFLIFFVLFFFLGQKYIFDKLTVF